MPKLTKVWAKAICVSTEGKNATKSIDSSFDFEGSFSYSVSQNNESMHTYKQILLDMNVKIMYVGRIFKDMVKTQA